MITVILFVDSCDKLANLKREIGLVFRIFSPAFYQYKKTAGHYALLGNETSALGKHVP